MSELRGWRHSRVSSSVLNRAPLPQEGLELGRIGRPPERDKTVSKRFFRRSGRDESAVARLELALYLLRFRIQRTPTATALLPKDVVDLIVFFAFVHCGLVERTRQACDVRTLQHEGPGASV